MSKKRVVTIPEAPVENIKREEVVEIDNSTHQYSGLNMDDEFRLISIRNAIAILPPNLMIDGKHTKANISAIVGFKITDEQWKQAYDTK